MDHWPKISIITPSYNQGQFLEETIHSVLSQNYPNLEYIIIDGGSTDNSVEIIKKYENKLKYWVSEKDNGQAHAINKGLNYCSGEIIAWINSDDYYYKGVFEKIAKTIDPSKKQILIGNCNHYFEKTGKIIGSNVQKKHEDFDIKLYDYIIQPSSFSTKKAWKSVGNLNEKLNYVFDWEWFIKAKMKNIDFLAIEDYLSVYRIHDDHKTGSGFNERYVEFEIIYKNYSGKSYKELFKFLLQKKEFIDYFIKFLIKIKLGRFDMFFLKIIFFKKLIKFKDIEIRNIIMAK